MPHLEPAVLPAAVLVAVAIGLAAIRTRTISVKLGAELIALAAILVVLVDRGTSPLPAWQALAARADGSWLRALAVVWWLVGARLTATVVALLRGRDARSRQARLFSDLVAGLIYVSAAYVIADTILDLPVRGLIATSGVIAVILGLALQNTLSDLFSGIAVGIEQSFRVGDAVTLDTKLEGTITDMNWRAVRLRTATGDIATVPNSVLAKASVINHSRPTERRTGVVEIPVRSHAPAGRLTELLRQSLALCPDVLDAPEPVIAIKSLDRFGATFAIVLHASDSTRLIAAQGQVLRQARRFLRHAGVLMGVPSDVRTQLRETTLFEHLSEESLAGVEASLSRAHLDAGDTLWARGAMVDALVIVTTGVLEVVGGEPGAERDLGRIGPGEYLGEIGMASGEASPVTVKALTAVQLLLLSKDALEALVERDAGLASALERSVRRGIARLERDAAARAVHPIDDEKGFLDRLRSFLGRSRTARFGGN